MKNQLKNLILRFYSCNGDKTINGKKISINENDKRVLHNMVGDKQTSIGQQSRIKTNR